MTAQPYTLTELMAVTAAREIRDGEVVFAGTGLPMLGAMLAQRTHAPGCCIIFEAGTVASQLAHLPMSVGDPRAMRGAAMAAGLSEVFTYVLQAGRVDVGFLSGAQVDRYRQHQQHVDRRRPAPSAGALLGQRRGLRYRLPGPPHDHHRPARETALPGEGRLHDQPWLAGGRRQPAARRADARRPQRGGDDQGRDALPARHARDVSWPATIPGSRPQAVADDTGFPLDVAGAIETPAPYEPRSCGFCVRTWTRSAYS